MEPGGAGNSQSSTLRFDKTRRGWTALEEKALIDGLKDIIANGWRSDNGFRTGYLKALEVYMTTAIPNTNIRAVPHITSRLSTWKKYYASLSSMLSLTGIGWNDAMKMIDVQEDQVWDDCVKKDPLARTMRHKSWPYYEDWIEIFGKDRATGKDAMDFPQASRDVTPIGPENAGGDFVCEEQERSNDLVDDSVANSIPQNSGTNTNKKKTRKRKMSDSHMGAIELLGQYCAETTASLKELIRMINPENAVAELKNEVYAIVDKMEGLSQPQKFLISKILVKNPDELRLFFSLPEDKRFDFVIATLSGTI